MIEANRSERIKNIISDRKPFADNLRGILEKIQDLRDSIEALEQYRRILLQKFTDPETRESLGKIELSTLFQRIDNISESMMRLISRFDRTPPTLNIGVVGRIKQGKSTLLQKLTGLGDDVIPTSKQICTTVRSSIYHRLEGDTTAEVTFYSGLQFFREIILPYYDALDLKLKPASLIDFSNLTLDPLPNGTGATKASIYNRLKSYKEEYEKYKEWLNHNPITVPKEEIKLYVSQPVDGQGKISDWRHLAVKHVKIFCCFPKSEVGEIALVDTPGLGDFKIGDKDVILKALGEEVDVVLFVRKPDSHADDWNQEDTGLYELANSALNNLSKRAFFVFNQTAENYQICVNLKQKLDERSVAMAVESSVIADCSNADKAYDDVLDPILNSLEISIANLDKSYFQSFCQPEIVKIYDDLKHLLQEIDRGLSHFSSEDSQFNLLFEGLDQRSGLLGEMINSLVNYLEQLQGKRDEEDSEFKKKAEDVINLCKREKGIPNSNTIAKEGRILGGQMESGVIYLKEIRAKLSNHFQQLDTDMQISIDKVKNTVAEILAKEGKLKNFSDERGADFLKEVAEKVTDRYGGNLSIGLRTIGEFDVSFAGIVLSDIRKEFSELYSDSSNEFPSSHPDEIITWLQEKYDKTLEKCSLALQKLYSTPNQIAYAMLANFIDQVFYTRGVKQEWRDFLNQHKALVWEEFQQSAKRAEAKLALSNLVIGAQKDNESLRHLVKQSSVSR
jgi:GTPase Era involved in 16S rRNA processing